MACRRHFITRDADNWTIGDLEHPTPRQRGFDRFFGIVDGGSNYFSPHYLIEDDSKVEVTADNFYFTDAITDKAIKITNEGDGTKPFFLYLAHTAISPIPRHIGRCRRQRRISPATRECI